MIALDLVIDADAVVVSMQQSLLELSSDDFGG